MKPCGHIVCKTCTDTLVTPAKQCIVCDVKLGEKDVIALTREGADGRSTFFVDER